MKLLAWTGACLIGGAAAITSAGEVLSQNFDEPPAFHDGRTIARPIEVGNGSWSTNNLTPGMDIKQPTVSIEQAHSKPHAVKLERGGDGSSTAGLIGSSMSPAPADAPLTLEYWVFPEAGGSFVSPLTNRARFHVLGVPMIYLTPEGALRAWDSSSNNNNGRYEPTAAKLEPGQWHGIQLKVDPKAGTYDVQVDSGQGWTAAASGVAFNKDALKDVDAVGFIPQAGIFFVDDVVFSEQSK